MTERVLYAEDVARLWNVSVRHARDLLEKLEIKHGPRVVGRAKARRGVRRFTTEAALASVGPYRLSVEDRVFATLGALTERIEKIEHRLDRFFPQTAA